MEIEAIVEMCLNAIYKSDFFNETLYLKGGQAVRLKESIKTRFSADIDFSVVGPIVDAENFKNRLEYILFEEFLEFDLHLFDFEMKKRPKIKKSGIPDFWGGWAISFKLIGAEDKYLDILSMRREAIVPKGTNSSKITFDISEYEYCDSIEKIKIKSAEVRTYSRVLLVLEKIRAICQQHIDYPYRGEGNRSRDYYDIERLWSKVLSEKNEVAFIMDCKRHLSGVFSAKQVSHKLLESIFTIEFIELQQTGWAGVKVTISGRLESFDYYNEILKEIVHKILD